MPVDVALLGCAHPHVGDLLAAVGAEGTLRLAAAWDADPSAVPLVLDGVATRSAETAIRRASLVVVCAPTDQRPALALQAARDGRPVLVLPPLATSATRADALLREVRRTRTPAAAAFSLRELPARDRLAAVLREGLLGRIAAVDAALTGTQALDGTFEGPRAWLRDPARAGVGGFGDRALHLLDLLASLPPGEPPRLAGVALDRPGAGQPDVGGTGLGRWAGVPLTLRGSWATRPGGLEVVVRGTAGTATLRDGSLELDRGGAPERWVGAPPDAGEALRAFAAAVLARRPPQDALARAVRAQAALERAQELR